MNSTQNDLPAPPAGLTVPGPSTGRTRLGLAVKWWCIGMAASGVGAIAGFVLAAMDAESCSGILCGLEDLLLGAFYGWGLGVLVAMAAASAIEGPIANKIAGLVSVVVGVLTLLVMLFLSL